MTEEQALETAPIEKSTKPAKPAVKKHKITLQESDEGPLSNLLSSLKERGVRNPDLSQVVNAAFDKMDETFWEEQLEELTPLEVRVQEAMEDPEMRQKLMDLLNKPV